MGSEIRDLLTITQKMHRLAGVQTGWRAGPRPEQIPGCTPTVSWVHQTGAVYVAVDTGVLPEPQRQLAWASQIAFFRGFCPLCRARLQELTEAEAETAEAAGRLTRTAGANVQLFPERGRDRQETSPAILGVVHNLGCPVSDEAIVRMSENAAN